jgi:4-amino-4-deoxy-L-arabinose transferase-like glycosyltransferase
LTDKDLSIATTTRGPVGTERAARAGAGWLAIVLGLHFVLGLMYDRATPVFEASDEGSHFAFVRWVSLGRGLPVQHPGQLADWEQEGSQPPLYYFMAAGLTVGIDTSDWQVVFVHNPFVRHEPGIPYNANGYRHRLQEHWPYQGTVLAVHVARWLSLTLSLATIFFTYRLALAVFPDRLWLALLAASFVAFIPMVLFINASVNNDNLLMPLSTAALWVSVHFIQPKVSGYAWKALILGLLLGSAALAKVSGLVLWPLAAVAVFWGAWRGRDWKRFVISGVIIAAAALAVCGWWYLRNQQLYGEWLGLNTMVAIAGPRVPHITLSQLILEESYGFLLSYWGVFGVFSILPAGWVFGFYGLLTLWAIVGGIWVLMRESAAPRQTLLLLAAYCLITLIAVINWTLQTLASQGRLMFGAIAPLSILLAAGILSAARPLLQARAGHNWSNGIVLTLGAGLALVAAVVPPAYIAPHYAPPPQIAHAQLPPDLRPIDVTIQSSIQLLGYTAPITPVVPGLRQPVTLYWRALEPIPDDYALAIHLLGRGGSEVTHLDTWPGGGNGPTSQWVPGAIYADTYLLPISPGAATPTQLSLALYFWDDDPYTALPMATAAGKPVGSISLTAGRLVAARSVERPPPQLDGSTFENGIELLGYDATADSALHLKLYWRLNTRERLPADYTVFLHLTDAQGNPVREPADGPPLGGDWPTSDWVPGQTVVDTRLLPLPAQLGSGRYDLQLGFYEPATGVRLVAYRPDGTPWQDNIVVLRGVVVR